MSLLHFRHRRRLTLLASGVLDGTERDETLLHVSACLGCARELEEIREVLSHFDADPVRSAEMPLPPGALTARVLARLDSQATSRPWGPGWRWVVTPALAGLTLLALATFFSPAKPAGDEATVATVSAGALSRLERTVAREHAVRYLNDAQDLLVVVAAAPRACRRAGGRVDVGEEARRGRELLSQRALLVDMGADALPSALPVLKDVDEMLQEVALLEPCARAGDLETIHKEIGRRNLLMKIGLMTRELQG